MSFQLVAYPDRASWLEARRLSSGAGEIALLPIPEAPGYLAGEDGRIYTTYGMGVGPKSPGRTPPRPLASSTDRYGYPFVAIKIGGTMRTRKVHALVCLTFHGPRPGPEFQASHLRQPPSNTRPDNLAWETPKQNHARRYEQGTALCGEANPASKLTASDVDEIRRLYAAGSVSQQAIGQQFGVAQTTISKIVRGSRWAARQ